MKTRTKTKERIRPLSDRVLVRRKEAEEKTSGGILLPETAKEKPKEGEVLAVGDGKTLDNGELKKPSVKRGDRIPFNSYAGTDVKFNGEDLIIMSEEDILAILA
jgi:chaperonin GroES